MTIYAIEEPQSKIKGKKRTKYGGGGDTQITILCKVIRMTFLVR